MRSRIRKKLRPVILAVVRFVGNQKRKTGTAAGDARSNATGGGGGNAASGLPEIKNQREAQSGTAAGDARSNATGGGGGNRTHG